MESGRKISVEELSNIFLDLQERCAENINLVSPTIYADQIAEAIKIAKAKGLKIPVIYNSNGYEKVETLKRLEGLIDVYLPDLKYAEDELGVKFSNVENYFEVATKAILEMHRQVGESMFDENGMIQKGLIIRHLIMPNHIVNTKKVLKWYSENLEDSAYISVMTQYFPEYRACEFEEINRQITREEYDEAENYIYELGIEKRLYAGHARRKRKAICAKMGCLKF